MPRTVEHIVETHRAATALRKAGKPIWSKTIAIKDILNEEVEDRTSTEHIADVSQRIAKRFRSALPKETFDITADSYDSVITEEIEMLESYTVESFKIDIEQGAEPVELFDGTLSVIYDWADDNRVWLGLG